MFHQTTSKSELYNFFQRRQDDLDRELTNCGSTRKINELRSYVLFIQEKIKEMEMLEKEMDPKSFETRHN